MYLYVWKITPDSGLIMQSNAATEFKSSSKSVVDSTPEPSYILPEIDNIPTVFQSDKHSTDETNPKFTQVNTKSIVGKSDKKSNERTMLKSTLELSLVKDDHEPATGVVKNNIIEQVDSPSTSYTVIGPTSNGSPDLVVKKISTVQPRRMQRGRKRNIDYTSGDEDDSPPKVKTCRLTDCLDSSSVSGSQCYRYRDLRDRNKEASRKFRQHRKLRDVETRMQETQLEKKNEILKMKVNQLEKHLETFKVALFKSMNKDKDI